MVGSKLGVMHQLPMSCQKAGGPVPAQSVLGQGAGWCWLQVAVLGGLLAISLPGWVAAAEPLERIRVSPDGRYFVRGTGDARFVLWGVNYDHDRSGRLLDEYWLDEWDTVVADFHEIKDLGANCVRIHLQIGMFLDAHRKPDPVALAQLKKLTELAEQTGVYLNITGLACYHTQNIPGWYQALNEQQRWAAQATFWEAVAKVCQDSDAVFCYDLMNEPILPGEKPETDWLTGELAGKFFVQRLTLDLQGRSREQVAEAWVRRMVAAIRRSDQGHLITVGVIPWVFVFDGGKPLFYSPSVGQHLDFVAVHFYPRRNEVGKAIHALQAYELGKPIIVEEMFPLKCSVEELVEFVRRSAVHVDGWFSFFWGETDTELRTRQGRTIGDTITAAWLERFRSMSQRIQAQEIEPDR